MANRLRMHRKVDIIERFVAGASYRRIQQYTGTQPNTIGSLIRDTGARCAGFLWQKTGVFDAIDVIRFDTRVGSEPRVALLAMSEDLVVGYGIGTTTEAAMPALLAFGETPLLQRVRRVRSGSEAVRSIASSLNQATATAVTPYAPFPHQYTDRCEGWPKQESTLDAGIALVSAHHNYCGSDPSPAMRQGLVRRVWSVANLIKRKKLLPPGILKRVDYDTAYGKIQDPVRVPHDHVNYDAIEWLDLTLIDLLDLYAETTWLLRHESADKIEIGEVEDSAADYLEWAHTLHETQQRLRDDGDSTVTVSRRWCCTRCGLEVDGTKIRRMSGTEWLCVGCLKKQIDSGVRDC